MSIVTFESGEFCAGAGGASLGFSKYFKHRWLNDNDATCCNTLRINFTNSTSDDGSNIDSVDSSHEPEIILSDMNILDFKEEKYQNLPFVFIGSPCQSFSYAGKKLGTKDPRGAILFKFIDFLSIAKPKTFLIENVKGLSTHENGQTVDSITDDMADLGYYITYDVLDASKFSVPQKRERFFIFGSLLDDKFEFPTGNQISMPLRGCLDDIDNNNTTVEYSTIKKKLYRKIPPGGCWKNLPISEQKSYLGVSYNSGGGKTGILARLSWDKPSLTLLTTPSQKQTERCHPDIIRPLTVKEYARIQTFPDDYTFAGSTTKIYKQIGNAVPVNLAEAIAKQIYEYLLHRKCRVLNATNTPLQISIKKSKDIFDKILATYSKDINIDDIDPFKKAFDIKHMSINESQWYEIERMRKLDKAVNNEIGYLHQTILGNADNWINLDDPKHKNLREKYKVDLCTSDFTTFVELKNKHNTMNGASKLETIRRLKEIKKIHKNAKLYIVAINSTRCATSEDIEYLPGNKFYEIVFGYDCFDELLQSI